MSVMGALAEAAHHTDVIFSKEWSFQNKDNEKRVPLDINLWIPRIDRTILLHGRLCLRILSSE